MFGSRILRPTALLGGLLLAQACSSDSSTPTMTPSGPAFNVGGEGAVLSVTKTGEGYWNGRSSYDWTVTKSVTPATAQVEMGASASFTYTVTATRSAATGSSAVWGMRGTVCVTNSGDAPTTNLAITDRLLQDNYIEVFAGVIDVSGNPVLDPGESHCYPYDFVLPSAPDLRYVYRNQARASFTRANGSTVDVFGHAQITWPTSPSDVTEDATASLTDVLTCPAGFTCTRLDLDTWTVTGTDTRQYTVLLQNVSAPCGTRHEMPNTVTLTESGSGQMRTASANVTITTPTCEPPPQVGQGCTPGYWKQKQHFDSWTSPYAPSTLFSSVFSDAFPGKTLLEVLGLGGGGINALGRHTVAALLNSASAGVGYNVTTSGVIGAFNTAYAAGAFERQKDIFQGYNEQGCPLN
jgi:hypothetical protein